MKPFIVDEKDVRKDFGKPFDLVRANKRHPGIRRLLDEIDFKGKIILDVGAGHCIIAAFLTKQDPDVQFDCLDFSPGFAGEAQDAVKQLRGDLSRINFITDSFYDIPRLKAESLLRQSYDLIMIHETLHHSTRKTEMLKGFHCLMNSRSKMLIVEPVLPILFRKKAYAASQWARDLNYVEDPVGKAQYLSVFKEAGYRLESMRLEFTRGIGQRKGIKIYFPEWLVRFYRSKIYSLYRTVSMSFILRSLDPQGDLPE